MTDNSKPGELMPDEIWCFKGITAAAVFRMGDPHVGDTKYIRDNLVKSPPVQSDESEINSVIRMVQRCLTISNKSPLEFSRRSIEVLVQAAEQRVAPKTGVDVESTLKILRIGKLLGGKHQMIEAIDDAISFLTAQKGM